MGKAHLAGGFRHLEADCLHLQLCLLNRLLTQHDLCRQTAKLKLESRPNNNISVLFWSNLFVCFFHVERKFLWLVSFSKMFFFPFFFSGEVGPPAPDSTTQVSDSASCNSPSREQHPKFMLVMSGGEGYIDFRKGKNTIDV